MAIERTGKLGDFLANENPLFLQTNAAMPAHISVLAPYGGDRNEAWLFWITCYCAPSHGSMGSLGGQVQEGPGSLPAMKTPLPPVRLGLVLQNVSFRGKVLKSSGHVELPFFFFLEKKTQSMF